MIIKVGKPRKKLNFKLMLLIVVILFLAVFYLIANAERSWFDTYPAYTVVVSAYHTGKRTATGTKPKFGKEIFKVKDDKFKDALSYVKDSEELENDMWKVKTATLAMTRHIKNKYHFKYGDVFYIPDKLPYTILLYEDVMPNFWRGKRDADIYLGNAENSCIWGVQKVVMYKIGHIDHPKFQKREKFEEDV